MSQEQIEFVENLMEQLGATKQETLAELLGVAQGTVSALVNGRPVSRRIAIRIAKKLGRPRRVILKGLNLGIRDEDRLWDQTHFPEHFRNMDPGISEPAPADRQENEGQGVVPPDPLEAPMSLYDSLATMGRFVNADEERVLSTVPGGYRGEREQTYGLELPHLVPYDYILQLEGDSMAPIYPEGTIVFVRKSSHGEPVLRRPNVVLIDEREPTCAYVEVGDEWETYVLYKENGDYEEEVYNARRLTFQGEVVFHIAPAVERRRRTL